MIPEFTVIIPARYDSTRLPGKVLMDIGGKTMLTRVIQAAKKSGAERIIVATDDERVEKVALKSDVECCMTSDLHVSGVERAGEVIEAYDIADDEIIALWQADEPFMNPKAVKELVLAMEEHETIKMGTLASPIVDIEELLNPSVVKVVLNKRHCAAYFSRAPIPWDRGWGDNLSAEKLKEDCYYRHIGLYVYTAKAIKNYVEWPASAVEDIEKLEQLRILHNGSKIYVYVTSAMDSGIDTQEDLDKAREKFKG